MKKSYFAFVIIFLCLFSISHSEKSRYKSEKKVVAIVLLENGENVKKLNKWLKVNNIETVKSVREFVQSVKWKAEGEDAFRIAISDENVKKLNAWLKIHDLVKENKIESFIKKIKLNTVIIEVYSYRVNNFTEREYELHNGFIKPENGIYTKYFGRGINPFKGDKGFGKHAIVKNPSVVEGPYFSNYSHLDKIDIKEGEIYFKGQVGEPGFATTPHVHSQVDISQSKKTKNTGPWKGGYGSMIMSKHSKKRSSTNDLQYLSDIVKNIKKQYNWDELSEAERKRLKQELLKLLDVPEKEVQKQKK